ncbi:hypothetical protein PG996_013703 [Apiospora saccharicola]|uniref:Carboxylic ester hydrolase n=1 Tax=Apiospora saccharicola TaxID=335842 RepID=A0ABR1U671_9PEZI
MATYSALKQPPGAGVCQVNPDPDADTSFEPASPLPPDGKHPTASSARRSVFWWYTEFGWLLIGFLGLAGVLAVLALYDTKPAPRWPLGITINSLVALLTSLSRLAFMVPLVQGMSQLKWVWFSSKPRPLADFQLYDEASRGPWGGVKILFKLKGFLGSLAALITLSGILTSTLTQQALQFQTTLAVSRNQTAQVQRCSNFDLYDGQGIKIGTGDQIHLKQAIFNGAFTAPNETIAPIAPDCPSAECKWPIYHSLSVCTEVVNLTAQGNTTLLAGLRNQTATTLTAAMNATLALRQYQQSYSGNGTVPAQFQVMIQGLPNPTYAFDGDANNAIVSDLIIAYSESMLRVDSSTGAVDVSGFQFLELAISWCTKSFSTEVKDGKPVTREVARVVGGDATVHPSPLGLNWAWSPAFQLCYGTNTCDKLVGGQTVTFGAWNPSSGTDPKTRGEPAETFEVGIWTALVTSAYLTSTLQDVLFLDQYRGVLGSASGTGAGASTAFGVALFGNLLDAASPSPEAQMSNLRGIGDSIANSVTNLLRKNFAGSNGAVEGTVLVPQATVRVEWKWMGLLATQMLLALLFLAMTVAQTKAAGVPIVKEDSLAILCGLSPEMRALILSEGAQPGGVQGAAAKLKAKLEPDGSAIGMRLAAHAPYHSS